LIVRDLTYQADRRQPVLLNWPDTSLTRGGDFQFRPVVFGEGQVSAELLGPKEPTEVKVDEQGISFRIAPNELATLFMLNIKISGPRDPVHYAVPLHVMGAPQAY